MKRRRMAMVATALVAALAVAACGSSNSSSTSSSGGAAASSTSSSGSSSSGGGTINGAGSTLAAPIYQQWGSTLKGQGLTVNYNPVGSGAGQTELESATVDFAGSDPALKPSDVAKMKGPVLQFPVAAGAITVSYNLSGVKSGLKLDGPTVAGIFMGKIKTWNDPAIKALNPGISLPSTNITVVHRSDSSGTTSGFTTWLSDVDPAWKSSVGEGKDVQWPTGTGGKGNSGVAAVVKQTSGAVGYVEQAYALENGFTYASIKNSAGAYVLPTILAPRLHSWGSRFRRTSVSRRSTRRTRVRTRSSRRRSWTPTRTRARTGAPAPALPRAEEVPHVCIRCGTADARRGSNQLPYAPLPSALADKDNTQLATMVCNGSPISVRKDA